jgi:hypothetical protein
VKNKIIQILFKRFYCAAKNDNRILIHCSMGISRSPTMATMYVMKKFKLSYEEVMFVYNPRLIILSNFRGIRYVPIIPSSTNLKSLKKMTIIFKFINTINTIIIYYEKHVDFFNLIRSYQFTRIMYRNQYRNSSHRLSPR